MEDLATNGARSQSAKSNKVIPLEIEESQKRDLTESKKGEQRDNWSGKLDFFFSALSFSVGLGAVWRFPYLCYKNGGGAFLVPFVIFLFIIGIPLMYLELSVGQFISRGPAKSWFMVPIFKGVGLSINLTNNYVNIYYIMIIAYSLYYLILSFNSTLPWEKCNPKWASPNCVDDFRPSVFNYTECESVNYLKCDDGQCYLNTLFNGTLASCETNKTLLDRVGYWNPIFPSQDYWNKVVLHKSEGIDETGSIVWQLLIALFAGWLVCFLALFRGIQLSGKIVYFTALFPYLVLFILGIRGVFLDGAGIGIEYFLNPKIEKLSEIVVWRDAAVQVFFTLSLSYGGLIALSSYNRFDHNVLRDSFILSITNFLTCILAGFVVFVYMGVLAKNSNTPIEKVVQGGQGLVYIVYPYAVTTIGVAPLWSVMFFVMMLALGMGSMMASVATLTTSLEDIVTFFKKNNRIRSIYLGVVCLIYFIIGLVLASQSGSYWIELFDQYSSNYGIFIIATFELVSVSWVYGIERFKIDLTATIPPDQKKRIKIMHGFFYVWEILWRFVTPVILIALVVLTLIDNKPLQIGDYTYPMWSHILGNFFTILTLFGILGRMIYEIVMVFKNKKPFLSLFRKDPDWRPFLDENNERVKQVHEEYAYLLTSGSIVTWITRTFIKLFLKRNPK